MISRQLMMNNLPKTKKNYFKYYYNLLELIIINLSNLKQNQLSSKICNLKINHPHKLKTKIA